jgi:trans-2,3-dihydro-3-hydroxyanthranilate isomerase
VTGRRFDRARPRPYTLLDVFTDVPLAGNALAVVHDADGVGDDVMLAFARETRLAETTFVQTATTPAASYRNRIWTIVEEMPFAGHPSLGTAVAVALERGESDVTYVQETRAGRQPVAVERHGDHAHASVLQERSAPGREVDAAAAMAAIGLAIGDAHPRLRPQVVSTGLPALIVPLLERAALARVRPDHAAIAALAPESFNLYACWVDATAGRAWARSLPSSPLESEDPATGSAAGALLGYLHAHEGTRRVVVCQGEEIGRPSTLVAAMEDGRPRVGGGVVVVATGSVCLP